MVGDKFQVNVRQERVILASHPRLVFPRSHGFNPSFGLYFHAKGEGKLCVVYSNVCCDEANSCWFVLQCWERGWPREMDLSVQCSPAYILKGSCKLCLMFFLNHWWVNHW